MALSPSLQAVSSSGSDALRQVLTTHPQPAFVNVSPGFSKSLSAAQLATLVPGLLNPLRPDGLLLLNDAREHVTLPQWQAALALGLDAAAPLLDPKKQFLPAAPATPLHRSGGIGGFSSFSCLSIFGFSGSAGGRAPTVKNLIAQEIGPLLDALVERTPTQASAYHALAEQLQVASSQPDYDEHEDEDCEAEASHIVAVSPGAGDSLMHWAAATGNTELVELIGRAQPSALHALNAKKQTPLHMAAQFLRGKTASALLDMGASIDAKDIQQYTPLAVALLFSGSHYPSMEYNEGIKKSVMEMQAQTGCVLLSRGAQYDKGPGRSLQSVVMMKNSELATQLKASYELYQMQSQIGAGVKVSRARL